MYIYVCIYIRYAYIYVYIYMYIYIKIYIYIYYGKLYFYAKHLEKGLKKGWWTFRCPNF